MTSDRPIKTGHLKIYKMDCFYGHACYNVKPEHFHEYDHPHLERILAAHKGSGDFVIPRYYEHRTIIAEQLQIMQHLPKERNLKLEIIPIDISTLPDFDPAQYNIEEINGVIAPKGKMADKHENSAPYHIFYMTITSSEVTHDQPSSITFQELLDPSLGKLSSSLQISYIVDTSWLFAQYYFAGYHDKPLTILYGLNFPEYINSKRQNVQVDLVLTSGEFGVMHAKIMLLCYEDDSIRVVVSTANLYTDEWKNVTQGLWLSPKCPRLCESRSTINGESPTGFKRSLIDYLEMYELESLTPFVDIIKHADFSAINVFFIGAIPGVHMGNLWGLPRIGYVLSNHCSIPSDEYDKWDLVVQSSGVGNYGARPNFWLTGDFQYSFCRSSTVSPAKDKKPALKLIYPSLDDMKNAYKNSFVPELHVKHKWINSFLYKWRAERSGRSQAIPHLKSYLRTSPDAKKAAFFLLTSGNVSKSAWGKFDIKKKMLKINSYEAGVLFLPKFVTTSEFFSIDISDPKRIPIPYDLPPVPYERDDEPFTKELHDKLDRGTLREGKRFFN